MRRRPFHVALAPSGDPRDEPVVRPTLDSALGKCFSGPEMHIIGFLTEECRATSGGFTAGRARHCDSRVKLHQHWQEW
jgi:hypothetical protein